MTVMRSAGQGTYCSCDQKGTEARAMPEPRLGFCARRSLTRYAVCVWSCDSLCPAESHGPDSRNHLSTVAAPALDGPRAHPPKPQRQPLLTQFSSPSRTPQRQRATCADHLLEPALDYCRCPANDREAGP
jgi:ribosomal protein L37AE/L43A